jgi:superfamily I DNA/RNA helicase
MLHKADPDARIVLTTFTRTLADAMQRDLRTLDPSITLAKRFGDPGVFVTGVDAAVSAVLKTGHGRLSGPIEKVLGSRSERIQARTTKAGEQWRESIESAADVPADLRNPSFFEAEYAMVVLPQRVTSREEYFRARRPGRGVALDRARRKLVWDVVQSYRALSSVEGSVDFGEAAAIAAELLDSRPTRPVDHVLVDEGQDLNPTHWQFLRALVAEGPDDIFIAEDAQQRIYGQRVVLGRFGIKIVGRSRRLALNYRTTAQNLQFAVGVLREGEYLDLEAEETDNTGYRSARTGPAPRLLSATSVTDELDQAASVAREWLEADVVPETIGILVRDAAQANQVARGLDERGIGVRVITNQSATAKQPQVMTMHRAKGMEFSRVLIFGAEEGLVPASYVLRNVGEAERADAMQRERSLFYVAATRARDELVVLWNGDKSQFLD